MNKSCTYLLNDKVFAFQMRLQIVLLITLIITDTTNERTFTTMDSQMPFYMATERRSIRTKWTAMLRLGSGFVINKTFIT